MKYEFNKSPLIQVCVSGAPPFICGVNGGITAESLAEIETEIKQCNQFDSDGLYYFRATHNFSDDCNQEYWELEYLGFDEFHDDQQVEMEAAI